MKREIKFRARSLTQDKHFVYGSYVTRINSRSGQEHLIVDINGIEHAIDIETLGQYIDLEDKNGKEIYEGDVVKQFMRIGEKEYKTTRNVFVKDELVEVERIGFIKFYEGGFRLYWSDDERTGHRLDNFDNDMVYYEIIGNIYENPELLKI